MKNAKTKCLCEAAIMLALAQILGYLVLFKLPNGGSIDCAMLPILLFCVRYGVGWGAGIGFVHGLLQYFLGNGISIDWTTMIADYLIAYTLMGIGAGLFRGKRGGVYFGTLVGGTLRFLSSFVVGATVWAKWMPDEFWGMPMTNNWVYSALYNATWAVPDICIVLALFALLYRPLKKYFTGADLEAAA
ncbi:MAG: energy-coupled thiamine transporter ThiT [Oscillospiraceae bacterium]